MTTEDVFSLDDESHDQFRGNGVHGEDSPTYCREAGEATTVPWPSDVTEESHDLDLRMGFLLPLAFDPFASRSTWWLAAMLRLLGGALVTRIARKRGLIHALIGLVLGPAYLLAAIVSETDVDIVAIIRECILHTAGSR